MPGITTGHRLEASLSSGGTLQVCFRPDTDANNGANNGAGAVHIDVQTHLRSYLASGHITTSPPSRLRPAISAMSDFGSLQLAPGVTPPGGLAATALSELHTRARRHVALIQDLATVDTAAGVWDGRWGTDGGRVATTVVTPMLEDDEELTVSMPSDSALGVSSCGGVVMMRRLWTVGDGVENATSSQTVGVHTSTADLRTLGAVSPSSGGSDSLMLSIRPRRNLYSWWDDRAGVGQLSDVLAVEVYFLNETWPE